MKQSFEISGMNCMHCVARVKKALEPLAEHVEVTLSPGLAVLTVKNQVSVEAVNEALERVGDYKATPLD